MNIKLVIAVTLILGAKGARSETLNLETFLNNVRSRNLELKIQSAKTDSSEAKSVGIAIPAPMVGVSQMKMRDGTTTDGFEVSQSIPFPTKITGDHSARKYEAAAQKEVELSQESEVLAQAKLAYIQLWLSQEKLDTLLEKRTIIDQHIKLSRSTVRSDNFLKLHVLKGESDRDLVENEAESLRATIRERQLQLGQFIYADLANFTPSLEAPPLSPIPDTNSLTSPPQVEAMRLTFEGYKSKEFVAKSSWLPDFELRYKQMGESSMFPEYEEYMVGISVPFAFFWQPHRESRTARAESLSAEFEYKREKQRIEADILTLLNRAESLKKQLATLNEKLLPRAERRMKIAHNLAPRDMETLQDHRDTMEAFPNLKLEALRLRGEYEETVSGLEKYISKGNPQ